MNRKTLSIGIFSIVISTIIFSTMEVMLKLPQVSGVFHPMQITMERFLIGGICLLPFALRSLKKRGNTISRKHLLYFAMTGMLCVPLSMALFQLSISHGQANVVAILFSGNPIFVTILAFLILREKIYWNNVVALGLSLVGILAIINPFSPETSVSLTSVSLVIISALLFSLYSVLGKKMTKVYGGIVVTCASFLFGAAELLFLLLLGRTEAVAQIFESIGLSILVDVPFIQGIDSNTILPFLYICLINSAAGYVFHMLALENTNANIANLIFFFKPIIAPLFALFILGEAITSNMIVGIVFLLLGSLSGIVPTVLRSRKAGLSAEPASPTPIESPAGTPPKA